MPTSLRAFLMVQTKLGDWDIEVFHTLEDVIRAWERPNEDQKTGVLHIGFERRVAKSFEELALQFVGKLMLTPGAKGALPASFITSKESIGVVDEEPVFLALEGWGYSEPQPNHICLAQSPILLDGWVRLFAQELPQELDTLVVAGIVDEQSYLDFEGKLDTSLRIKLGQYRFAHLIGGSREDPTAVARAAPPWLGVQELSQLSITVRIGNVFRGRSIIRVADIGQLTMSDLLAFPNFGRTSIHHLADILHSALLDGPNDRVTTELISPSLPLLEAVRRSLDTCKDRERDIMMRRMGLGCPRENLREIGPSHSLSHERIRQIEADVVNRLVRQEVWDDILAAKLHILLAEREFPLPLIGAEALDPWFSGVAAERDAVRYLISNMCSAGVSLVEIDGVEYLSFLTQENWQETIVTARQLLSSGVDKQWSEQDCQHYVKLLVPESAREFGAILWEISSKWCHFAESDNGRTLISYGRGVEQVVEAILLESDGPLHYSEIALLAAKRSGRDMDERRVHNAASEVGYLFGSGIYGMLKHVSVSRDEWEAFADEATEIIADAALDRQWHASELINLLIERGVELPDSFDKYQMDIALKQAGQLRSLGRMVWTNSEASNESARVDIRQAVIAILQSAGEPLTSIDLRQRLVAVRGINQGMQFQVIDPLIKLNSQLWALNDRDLAIKRLEQPAFLDSVVAQLQLRMKPIHILECEEIMGNVVPARAVFCLASLDERLQVTSGRMLTLREWAFDSDDSQNNAVARI
jgi:hypothetical protein